MVALLVMLRRRAMGLRSVIVMLRRFAMRFICHFHFSLNELLRWPYDADLRYMVG
jgi:hypothetical protein